MAKTGPQIPLPPSGLLQNPVQLKYWFDGLNPVDKTIFSAYIVRLAQGIPFWKRSELRRRAHKAMAEIHSGALGEDASTSSGGFDWGGLTSSLATAVIGAGTNFLNQKEANSLQKDLASMNMTSQLQQSMIAGVYSKQIASQQQETQKQLALLQGNVQTDLAKISGASSVELAKIQAEKDAVLAQIGTPVKLVAIGGILLIGGIGAWLYLRKKKK